MFLPSSRSRSTFFSEKIPRRRVQEGSTISSSEGLSIIRGRSSEVPSFLGFLPADDPLEAAPAEDGEPLSGAPAAAALTSSTRDRFTDTLIAPLFFARILVTLSCKSAIFPVKTKN